METDMRDKLAAFCAVVLLAGIPVFAKSVDSDNDGIKDRKDACSSTPTGAKVDKTGCPIDSDGDGVADGVDRCTKTATGWPVDETGCPADSDRDGVPDGQDTCASTPTGAKVDERGCTSDSDSDQVLDGLDRCAATPQGYRVDGYGCPVDSDHDGVNDAMDQCADSRPQVTVDANGCQVKAPALFEPGVDKIRLEGVTFEKNKIEIPADSEPALMNAATALKDWPDVRVEIGVHTDRAGSAAANRDLSQRRAEYVKNYLVSMGVDESRLTAKGYGEKAEKGTTPERSVELIRAN
jgi:outer membrane protein OmpA-like peptidoglycan-associated protein